jgi:acyl carrier protein
MTTDINKLLPGIREIVFMRTHDEVPDDEPLVSGGRIDSMLIVDLILDLEERFSVTIPPGDVQPDDFDSINKIASTVARFAS